MNGIRTVDGRSFHDSFAEMLDRSSETVAGGLPADPLSQVLQDLRLSGVAYGRCELGRPWGLEFPPAQAARFHFVVDGECWLRTPEGPWIRLDVGDVVLLPRGTGHALADRPERPTRPIDDFPLETIGDRTYRLADGTGPGAVLFCGTVGFEEPSVHPLLGLMPSYLRICADAGSDATLPALLTLMAEEVLGQRIGAATVLTRLADLVIARIVRAWVEAQCGEPTGWLAAIRDPRIGRALAAIHRKPEQPWSVAALAQVARCSRSAFSERFTAVVGVSPARYLARWRMHVAGLWLRRQRLTVTEVALRLGYESEASFSRAFKRVMGRPPSAFRRPALDEPSPERPVRA